MTKVFYDKPIIEQIFEEFGKSRDSQDMDKLINLMERLPLEDVNTQDEHGHTLLILASFRGYTEIVKLLLEKGGMNIDIDSSLYGATALTLANAFGHNEIAKLLKNHQK